LLTLQDFSRPETGECMYASAEPFLSCRIWTLSP